VGWVAATIVTLPDKSNTHLGPELLCDLLHTLNISHHHTQAVFGDSLPLIRDVLPFHLAKGQWKFNDFTAVSLTIAYQNLHCEFVLDKARFRRGSQGNVARKFFSFFPC